MLDVFDIPLAIRAEKRATADEVYRLIANYEFDPPEFDPREFAWDLRRTMGVDEGWLLYRGLVESFDPFDDNTPMEGDLRGDPDRAIYDAEIERQWKGADRDDPTQYDRLLVDEVEWQCRKIDFDESLEQRLDQFRNRHPAAPQCPMPQSHLSIVPQLPAPDLIQTSEEFVKAFVPPDYLVDGIFQRRYFYAITAQTGVGKTAVALLLTALVGSGKPLGDRTVEQGEVLYMAGENPDDVRARWIGLAQSLNLPVNVPYVHFMPSSIDLFDNAERITQEVVRKGIQPALVIVDTAAAYNRGDDENNNAQQVAYARHLRSLTMLPGGPCVLVLCHPPKNATGEDALLPRGGGSFLAELDGNVTVTKQDAIVTLRPGKFRGAANWWISCELKSVFPPEIRDSKGRDVSTVVAVPISDIEKQARDKDMLRGENIVLKDVENHPDDSLTKRAERMCWRTRKGGPDKTKVDRALRRLEKEKLIERLRGDGWAVTRKGSLELSRLGLNGPQPAFHPMIGGETARPPMPPTTGRQ